MWQKNDSKTTKTPDRFVICHSEKTATVACRWNNKYFCIIHNNKTDNLLKFQDDKIDSNEAIKVNLLLCS